MEVIDVAKEFSDEGYLGKRKIIDSDYSGEEFRQKFLEILIDTNSPRVCFDFDNCYNLPPSFMSEAFQVLFKKFSNDQILSKIAIKLSSDLQRKKLLDKIHEVNKSVTSTQLYV